MATIGSLAVNVVAKTGDFERGMKRARGELRGFSGAAGMLKGKLLGLPGLALGALGIGSVTAAFKKGIKEIEGSMKHLGDFSKEEQTKIIAANQSIQEMKSAVGELSREITAKLAPALAAVAKPLADLVSMKGLVATPGSDTGSFSAQYSRLLGAMSDEEFRRLQRDWNVYAKRRLKGEAGGDAREAVLRRLGISGRELEFSQFATAIGQRGDEMAKRFAARGRAHDMAVRAGELKLPEILSGIGRAVDWLNRTNARIRVARGAVDAPLSLAEEHRMLNEIDEWRMQQTVQPRGFADHGSARGFAALEGGTAEAFAQAQRSRNQEFDVAKQSLEEQKKQTEALAKIDENTRTTQQLEVVNIA